MTGYEVSVERFDHLIVADIAAVNCDVRQEVFRQVIDLRERLVIERLIELGWTPPAKGAGC